MITHDSDCKPFPTIIGYTLPLKPKTTNRPPRPAEEIDPAARQVIHDHHRWLSSWSSKQRSEPHSFGSVLGWLQCGKFWDSSETFLQKWSKMSGIPLSNCQYCFTHGQECPNMEEVDVDFSGLPCQHNSRANCNRLMQDGPTNDVYIAWSRRHRKTKTPLLILENTEDSLSLIMWNFLW